MEKHLRLSGFPKIGRPVLVFHSQISASSGIGKGGEASIVIPKLS